MRQLLSELDSYELTEWIAFYQERAWREQQERERAEFQQRLNEG